MKTEKEIREMIAVLSAFNSTNGVHDLEIRALQWVVGDYPPQAPALVHGVNCYKAPHEVRGIAHHPDYDGPVTAGLAPDKRENGADYCGRCHERLS